jgi:hypothetical protein
MHLAASWGDITQVPKEFITSELLLLPNNNEDTVIHLLAERGRLGDIPLKLLTKKVLLLEDGYGRTPIGAAAAWGNLQNFPKKLITEEFLTRNNKEGLCPIDHAIDFNENTREDSKEFSVICKKLSDETLQKWKNKGFEEFEVYLKQEIVARLLRKRFKRSTEEPLEFIE